MFYEMKMFYAAMRNGCSYGSPHTVCYHYSPLDVHNLHDLPVSDDQIKGRSLMKTFAVAAAAARQEFGVGFFSKYFCFLLSDKIKIYCTGKRKRFTATNGGAECPDGRSLILFWRFAIEHTERGRYQWHDELVV